ncbi:hypothetical protein ACJRO7_029907 [Eucalyptus globulus]|uniref:Cation-transporting P-type ATPase C-terminal domain-containing protein n=1 Tax=Eucalyptus globulus TaxID=34317 RepID=A0ABD3JCS3_EUCGL
MEPLITNVMWRNLVAQATYQMAVLLTLQFKGEAIFGVDEMVKRTLIFNAFILCQVFNEFNARKLEKKNGFEGESIIRNIEIRLDFIQIKYSNGPPIQVVMVEFLKRVANTAVELGPMGRVYWDRGCILAYWLGRQVHPGP